MKKENQFFTFEKDGVLRTRRVLNLHADAILPFRNIKPGTEFKILALPFMWVYLGFSKELDEHEFIHDVGVYTDKVTGVPSINVVAEHHRNEICLIKPDIMIIDEAKMYILPNEGDTKADFERMSALFANLKRIRKFHLPY